MQIEDRKHTMKKKSLFRKLTVLIIAAAVTITILTNFAVHINFKRILNDPDSFHYFKNSVQFIIDNVDINDTAAVIKELSRMGLSLRYKNSNKEWCSDNNVPDIQKAQRLSEGKHVFWYDKRLGIHITSDNGSYVVLGKGPLHNITFHGYLFHFPFHNRNGFWYSAFAY